MQPDNLQGAASGRPGGNAATLSADRLSMRTKRLLWVWGFLAIPILFYAVIRFYPTLQAFYLSMTNWDLVRPAKFVGFANYFKLFFPSQANGRP